MTKRKELARRSALFVSGLCVSGLVLAWGASAAAQAREPSVTTRAQDEGEDPNAIVVTATRQSVRLDKVPLSVAALSSERMDQQGVRQIDDIARLVPGVSFSRSTYGNGSGSSIAIRGISSSVGAATTGIYINDTPIQVRTLGFTATNTYPKVFDLERVEVVRGPQGTLFGAGAEGGAVRFITPSPNLDHYEGYARSELASTQGGAASYEGGVAIGGPIIAGRLGFRASAWYRRDGGYVDRIDYLTGTTLDRNANSQDSYVGRIAVTWKPADNLEITPSLYYQNIKTADSSVYWEAYSPRKKDYKNASVVAQPSTDRFWLPALNIQYDAPTFSVISATSYFNRRSQALFDYTGFTNATFGGSALPLFEGYVATSQMNNWQKNWNQELRIQSNDTGSSLKWVVGAFYSHSRQQGYQSTVDPYLGTLFETLYGITIEQATGTSALAGDVVYLNVNTGSDRQLAGFGQVDLTVAQGLTATAGVRVADTSFSFHTNQQGPGAGGTIIESGKQSETPVTPKFGLSYETPGGTLLYTSAAKGYRIGGVNSSVNPVQCAASLGALGLSEAPSSYNSDSLWSYEGGVKGRTAHGALAFEASGFYIDWSNLQQSIYLSGCGLGFVANAGKASSRGFDMAVQVHPNANFTFSATLGYVDARYDESVYAGSDTVLIVGKGDKIAGSPWSLNLSVNNTFAIADHPFYARLDYDYRSRASSLAPRYNPANFSYDPSETPADEQNNLSVRVGARLGGADLSVFVNNLLDQKPSLARSHYTSSDPYFTNITVRPRTFGVTGTYRY